jgi:hypothetical protein
LLAADQRFESLVHIERAGHEARPHRPSVRQHDAAGRAAFDQNALDRDLRLITAACRDESFHQAARQIERAALTELIAAF